jgi:hypothetical protein
VCISILSNGEKKQSIIGLKVLLAPVWGDSIPFDNNKTINIFYNDNKTWQGK